MSSILQNLYWKFESEIHLCRFPVLKKKIEAFPGLCHEKMLKENVLINFHIHPKIGLWRREGPAIAMTCQHNHLIAEGWLYADARKLHNLRGPTEIYYLADGTKTENWFIDGVLLPEFSHYITLGQDGIAEYLKTHKEYRKEVLRYLEHHYPDSRLAKALTAGELLLDE